MSLHIALYFRNQKNNIKESFQACLLTLVLAYQPHQLTPVSACVFLLVLLFLHLMETFCNSVYCLVLHTVMHESFSQHTNSVPSVSFTKEIWLFKNNKSYSMIYQIQQIILMHDNMHIYKWILFLGHKMLALPQFTRNTHQSTCKCYLRSKCSDSIVN